MVNTSNWLGAEPCADMTLEEFLKKYVEYHDVADSTIDQYRYVLRCFGKHLQRPPLVADLHSDAVNAWLAGVKGKLSPWTIKSRKLTILSIWRQASDLDLVPPPRHVRKVKTPQRVVHCLTSMQANTLFWHIDKLPGKYRGYLWRDLLRTWIQCVLETAMRPGDMRRLDWPYVRDHSGQFLLAQEKTGKIRQVRLSDRLLADIAEWHAPTGPIWPVRCKNAIGRRIKSLGKLVGHPALTHTILRQTAISDVENQQPGIGWRFAGHASPETTRNWYIDADHAYRDIPRPRF